MSPKHLSITSKPAAKSLLLTAIPKPSLHHILHYLVMQQIKARDTGVPLQTFPNGRHRYFLFGYHKSFQMVNRLKGTALSLVKRQFIKKPKNPI